MRFNKNDYLTSSFVKHYLPYIQILSKKLYQTHHVKFLSYTKQYDNGQSIELCTNSDWLEHRIQHFNTSQYVIPRLNMGMHFWDGIKDIEIQNLVKTSKSKFSIDAITEFVHRDNIQDCFHLYSFHTSPLWAKKTRSLYTSKKAQFLRMITNINNKGYQNIPNTIEDEIAITVINYKFNKEKLDSIKKFSELLEEKLFYKLTDHEMEIITLYGAGGFTAKQIAYFINKSQKTVEYHISNIRNKTNLKDRKAMNAYAREKGWDKLVSFYSNLSNSNIQAFTN